MFINGSLGGMVLPSVDSFVNKSRGVELSEEFGRRLGERVLFSFREKFEVQCCEIFSRTSVVRIPFENRYFRAAAFLGLLPNSEIRGGFLRTEINLIAIGNLQIITVPGEILPGLGLEIRGLMSEPNMLWSLSNDEIGYILRREDYFSDLYRYERSMSVGSMAGELILESAMREIQKGF